MEELTKTDVETRTLSEYEEGIKKIEALLECRRRMSGNSYTDGQLRSMREEMEEKLVERIINQQPTTHTPQEQTSDKHFLRYMERQGEHELHPWKRAMRRSLDAMFPRGGEGTSTTEGGDKLRLSTFEDRALGGLLTPYEALIGIYLNPTEARLKAESKQVLHHLLFMVPRKEVYVHHNWYILGFYPEMIQHTWGPLVEHLPYPLYPPGKLGQVNETIMMIMQEARATPGIHPADAEKEITRRMERFFHLKGREAKHTSPKEIVGGMYVEPVFDAHGRQTAAIQMEGTDARLTEIYSELKKLSNQARAEKPRPRLYQTRPAVTYGRAPQVSERQHIPQPRRRPQEDSANEYRRAGSPRAPYRGGGKYNSSYQPMSKNGKDLGTT